MFEKLGEQLGPGHMQVLVDTPPRGIFTYEDTVSGKVVFELTKDFALGFVYVFFHGWVSTHVCQATNNVNNAGPRQTQALDKEILFQYEKKVYQGHEKALKNNRFELPFKFDFYHPSLDDLSTLPTSGKYGACSVEYKVVVACGVMNQDEELFLRMRNPDDRLFQKEAPMDLNKLEGKIASKLGAGAEQRNPVSPSQA